MSSTSFLALVALLASPVYGVATLQAYNVDPDSVSVSGLSAGGFMAAQLGVAYSDTFRTGFGVFAGGPFDCARSQFYSTCMNNGHPSITQPTSNMESWSGKQIDPLSNLAARQVYMEVGTSDSVVGPNVMAQLKTQLANFDSPPNTTYVTTPGAAHTFPTNFDGAGDNACGLSSSPYISNCGYDGAGEVLKWMYGEGLSAAPNTGTQTGSVMAFSQTGGYGAAGMDTTGYMYVPKACQDGGTVCRLHVALHGCLQSFSSIQMKYITNTGYNRWADTNNIIILYPQGVPDNSIHTISSGIMLSNPNGCFDWVGWYGNNFDQHGGVQMVAMVNMVNQITSGYQGGSPPPPASTSTSTLPTATTSSSGPGATPGAPLYGQCAGFGWTGPTTCEEGTCTSYSPYYGQCL